MPMSKILRTALVAAALAATGAAPPAVLPALAQSAAAGAISIDNFTFSPQKLTVKAGTTITFTNHDDIPHGIAWTNDTLPRSKALDTDDSVSVTFSKPGTYQYFCYIHPHMTGTIVVEAATGTNPTR